MANRTRGSSCSLETFDAKRERFQIESKSRTGDGDLPLLEGFSLCNKADTYCDTRSNGESNAPLFLVQLTLQRDRRPDTKCV